MTANSLRMLHTDMEHTLRLKAFIMANYIMAIRLGTRHRVMSSLLASGLDAIIKYMMNYNIIY
jgi:hypothetical protein